jgi:hypothetical protein
MTLNQMLANIVAIENALIDHGFDGEVLDDARKLVNRLIDLKAERKAA